MGGIKVVSKKAIVSDKGLLLAEAGRSGELQGDRLPHERRNVGRVCVLFEGLKRCYWVDPDQLECVGGQEIKGYAAASSRWGVIRSPRRLKLPRYSDGLEFDFGRNLKLFREARGLSQVQLAEMMEVRQSTISYREGKRNSPGRKFVSKVSGLLEVPPFSFFFPLDDVGKYMAARLFLNSASSAFLEQEGECPRS